MVKFLIFIFLQFIIINYNNYSISLYDLFKNNKISLEHIKQTPDYQYKNTPQLIENKNNILIKYPAIEVSMQNTYTFIINHMAMVIGINDTIKSGDYTLSFEVRNNRTISVTDITSLSFAITNKKVLNYSDLDSIKENKTILNSNIINNNKWNKISYKIHIPKNNTYNIYVWTKGFNKQMRKKLKTTNNKQIGNVFLLFRNIILE